MSQAAWQAFANANYGSLIYTSNKSFILLCMLRFLILINPALTTNKHRRNAPWRKSSSRSLLNATKALNSQDLTTRTHHPLHDPWKPQQVPRRREDEEGNKYPEFTPPLHVHFQQIPFLLIKRKLRYLKRTLKINTANYDFSASPSSGFPLGGKSYQSRL